MPLIDPTSLHLAYFSPLPPQRSGISDYSRELLPFLASLASVTLFVDDPTLVLDELHDQYEIRPYSDYPTCYQQFDLPIYHLGNSHFHKNIYQTFTHFPGLVVLHDYILHHFFADQQAWHGLSRYQRELGYEEGIQGTNTGWQTLFSQTKLDPFAHPLNGRVLDLSLGLIVHSQYVSKKVSARNPTLPVAHIPQLMPMQSGQSKRNELPMPDDGILFASIGLITASKQIEFALTTFATLVKENPNIYYLLVGEVLPDVPLNKLITDLNLQDRVFPIGYANDLQSFVDWIATADVIINLRYPTTGETSATALRTMALGKPIIVFDHGWYGEIANDACVKLPLLNEMALLQSMENLANSANFRQQIGANALQYIKDVCHPQQIAQNYMMFIETLLQKYKEF